MGLVTTLPLRASVSDSGSSPASLIADRCAPPQTVSRGFPTAARRAFATMASASSLQTLILDPLTQHTATVVFLHGLGDTGHGWGSVAELFRRDPGLQHIKWILPHAPNIKVTANFGQKMPAWFDILSFDFDNAVEDEDGMLHTVESVSRLIRQEGESGISSGRIVIGGFSQGAAISLLTGLSGASKLAGIVSLSGWTPLRHKLKAMRADHASSIPVFWGHGISDPLVTYPLGVASVEFLKSELGLPTASVDTADAEPPNGIAFHSYRGLGHSSAPEELADLMHWLKKVIPKQ
ncbi:Phospholipase/Carboxylesterase-domain-containing protein [Gloeopeniophorella convolvens]|nr:Phospholipase/Carboxylesterase-domain-containing protein [Gloeopeniophorella convolvens]